MAVTDDLTAPTVIDDPYGYFGHLRENDPVHRNEKWGGWILTRYEDVQHWLHDDEHLAMSVKGRDRLEGVPHDMSNTETMFPRWLIFLDPPEHTRLRKVIAEAFNPEMIEEQRSKVEAATESLIDEIRRQDRDRIELIESFAFPLPVRIISDIMGLPASDEDRIGRWSKNIALSLLHYYDVDDRYERTEESVREFSAYLREIVRDRREEPRDDLLTYLLQAETEGETLDEDEVIATAMLLLFAGHETTTRMITNGVLSFLRNPAQKELLREDPSLAPKAVEEVLRYQGPSKAMTRGVVEDFELRGRQIETGERIMLSLAAANRDPRKFDDPETFDITRGTMEHLGFGRGTHHCLGAALARLEGRTVFPALFEAFPDMELATDEIEWVASPIVRGPKAVPLRI